METKMEIPELQTTELPQYTLQKIDEAAEQIVSTYGQTEYSVNRRIKKLLYPMIQGNGELRKLADADGKKPYHAYKQDFLGEHLSILDNLLKMALVMVKGDIRSELKKAFLEIHDWSDLEIEVISRTEIRTRTKGGVWKRHTMSGMKLNKGSKGDAPGNLWTLLTAFAECDGHISWGTRGITSAQRESMQKNVQRLARKLRDYFGLERSPFYPYRSEKCYRAKFKKISIPRPIPDDHFDRNE
jgi:hypothetical protein